MLLKLHFGPLSLFARRSAIAALLWWVLTDGALESWLFAIPAITGTAAASLFLNPRSMRFRPLHVLPLAAWFLRRALLAGGKVAILALRPRLFLDPGFKRVRLRLHDPASRVLLANAVSLLPGTLSVELLGDELELHVLDRTMSAEGDVRELERRIAAALASEPESV